MSNPLRTSEDYELFLYTLGGQFPSVRRSTMTFIRRGAALARVAGDLDFDHDIRLKRQMTDREAVVAITFAQDQTSQVTGFCSNR